MPDDAIISWLEARGQWRGIREGNADRTLMCSRLEFPHIPCNEADRTGPLWPLPNCLRKDKIQGMTTASVLAIVGFLFPVVIRGLAQVEKSIGPRVLRWIDSRLGPNARVS